MFHKVEQEAQENYLITKKALSLVAYKLLKHPVDLSWDIKFNLWLRTLANILQLLQF